MSQNTLDDYQSTDKPYRNEDIMRELYVEKGLCMTEVAERLDCSRKTIQRWLPKHGIGSRGHAQEPRNKLDIDEDRIREMYVEEMMTGGEIAEVVGCNEATIYKRLKKMGVEKRDHGEWIRFNCRKSPDIPLTLNSDGYEVIEHTYDLRSVKVRLHRLIAVAKYGFEAVKGKEVHHKNGVEWDNRWSNIEIKGPTEHRKHHADERREDGIGPQYSDKSVLEKLYYTNGMTMEEMGDELGCSLHVIAYWMDEYGLERTRTNAK